jgi:hypothetical protein
MAAHEVVAGLRDVVATTIESLRRVSPLADADVKSVRDFHAEGLPAPNIDLLRDKPIGRQPWWAGIVPPLAARLIDRSDHRKFGSEIREAVRFHDRQVRSWLSANIARLVELYESQASVFREQIRRLAAESANGGVMGAQAELEADLRALRRDETNGGARLGAAGDCSENLKPTVC